MSVQFACKRSCVFKPRLRLFFYEIHVGGIGASLEIREVMFALATILTEGFQGSLSLSWRMPGCLLGRGRPVSEKPANHMRVSEDSGSKNVVEKLPIPLRGLQKKKMHCKIKKRSHKIIKSKHGCHII
jgi:hypothetical protein